MISKYIQELKNECRQLVLFVKKIYKYLVFKRIKRKAFRWHKKHNCQVFVVKLHGKVKIINKYQFKQMRQKGLLSQKFTATELKSIALYYTPKHYDKKRISGTTRKV